MLLPPPPPPHSSAGPPSTSAAPSSTLTRALPTGLGRKRRSCLTCSRRKVKCDKQKPCHNCVKIGSECEFPDTLPSGGQIAVTPQLIDMLQRLERAVRNIEPQSASTLPTKVSENVPESRHSPVHHQPGGDKIVGTTEDEQVATIADACPISHTVHTSMSSADQYTTDRSSRGNISLPFTHREGQGRLVNEHGRDTYVRAWFWDIVSTEVT